MPTRSTRDDIVHAADGQFYAQGFDKTSFSDIAKTVNISRGNFYYHFKTKDDILEAVIRRRVEAAKLMLAEWETDGATPAARLRSFINILIVNRDQIRRHGCPIGSLFAELARLGHQSEDQARALFGLFRVWLRRQFELAGLAAEADALAMHLLAMSQGVSALMVAFPDDAFLRREVDQMTAWLEAHLSPTAV